MVSLGCLAKAGPEQGDNMERLGGPGTGTPDGVDGLWLVLHSDVQEQKPAAFRLLSML